MARTPFENSSERPVRPRLTTVMIASSPIVLTPPFPVLQFVSSACCRRFGNARLQSCGGSLLQYNILLGFGYFWQLRQYHRFSMWSKTSLSPQSGHFKFSPSAFTPRLGGFVFHLPSADGFETSLRGGYFRCQGRDRLYSHYQDAVSAQAVWIRERFASALQAGLVDKSGQVRRRCQVNLSHTVHLFLQ